jgi:hypothetical protein
MRQTDALEDWHHLREGGRLNRSLPFRAQVRQAAPAIGMTPAALEKALRRAGIRADRAPA